jgi:hypothetical protein
MSQPNHIQSEPKPEHDAACGASSAIACSAVSVRLVRQPSAYPECDDTIKIDICGGMNCGGSTIFLTVPTGHGADQVVAWHTEGLGEEFLDGKEAKYDFKPNPTEQGIDHETGKKA